MKQTDRCHPIEVRPFTYRENARIQTFPDEWNFDGKLSEKYNLLEAISRKVFALLQAA